MSYWEISHSQTVELMNPNPLQACAPCEESLLNSAITNVDSSMLRKIAEADYGEDVNKHYRALTDVYRGDITPRLCDWHPREVLELTRWSEPDTSPHPADAVGTRGHWMRLFACTVLLRVDRLPECRDHLLGNDSTIIQLTESAIALGPKVVSKAISFLAWYLLEDEVELCPDSALAILMLAVQSQTTDPAAFQWLIPLIRGEYEKVDEWEKRSVDPKCSFADCTLNEKWRHLTTEILLAPFQQNTAVRSIAEALLG